MNMDDTRKKIGEILDGKLRSYTNRRLKVRQVDLDIERFVDGLGDGAIECSISHGGSVANAYDYPAATEGVAMIALREGRKVTMIAGAARVPANKVTDAGVIAAALGEWARPLADRRYGKDTTAAAWREARRRLRLEGTVFFLV